MSRSRIAQLSPQFRVSLSSSKSISPAERIFSYHQRRSVSSFHSSSVIPTQISKSNVANALSPYFVSLRRFSISPNQQKTFTVSYLTDSLGFSQKNAMKAYRFVKFRSPEKPDNVVSVLKGYGFTQTQISDIARRLPEILVSVPDKAILPILDFFRAQGISDLDLSKMISVSPKLLKADLDGQIRPSYELCREVFNSDEKAAAVFRRWPHVLAQEFGNIAPNVRVLRDSGVPDSNIAALLENQPKSLAVPLDRFRKVVKEVDEMGYDASRVNFVVAVLAGVSMGKATRNSMAGMDFFVNQPCFSEKLPLILGYSMKKRVIPRCSVLHVLLSNGSLKEKDLRRRKLLQIPEKKFVRKFISPYTDYRDPAPSVMKLYREKKGRRKKTKESKAFRG